MLTTTQQQTKSSRPAQAALLHGDNLPRKQSTLTLNVTGFRECPDGFNAEAIMDFTPVKLSGVEYGAMAINKTNFKAISAILGPGISLEKFTGKVEVTKVLVNNPSNNQMTYGLRVTDVKPSKSMRPKAHPASRRSGKGEKVNT